MMRGRHPVTGPTTGRPVLPLPVLLLAVLLLAVLLLAALAPAEPVHAAPLGDVPGTAEPLGGDPVLLVLDASGSMNADDGSGRSKIDAARAAVTQLIDGLPADAPVGLRAYGHRTDNLDPGPGCADTELLVPVGTDNRQELTDAVTGLRASGFTPIGASLRAALQDLPPDVAGTVVLVSDGIDTCAPPAACDVAREIVAEGVRLRVETIGFQVDAAAAAELQCIADSTGGTYRSADDADDLARELRANVAVGTPVEGGPTPAEALLLEPGQYTDTLLFPSQRWYAVTLQPGDRLRATAAVIGGADLPAVPGASLELILGYTDVIGLTPCATDDVVGIGPFTTSLAVDGLRVAGGTVCGDPGTYAVGLRVTPGDRAAEEVLAGSPLAVELFLAITSDPVATAAVDQQGSSSVPPSVAGRPGPAATPTSAYVMTFAGFLLLGGAGGVVLSRRMGP